MSNQKYDVRNINWAKQPVPHFLCVSSDNKLIMRRDENGDFLLISDDQTVFTPINKDDAKDFALWILLSN